MKYQLFGERCSGTNYVVTALSVNFPNLEQCFDYGFKHWLQPAFLGGDSFPTDLLFVIVVRGPIDWLRSMHLQPWHVDPQLRALSFSRFIRSEWRCVWDEQAGVTPADSRWMKEMDFERNPLNGGMRFKNILELRSVKYRLWREKLTRHPMVVIINFEAFLADPLSVFQQVAGYASLPVPLAFNMPSGYKGGVSWKRNLLLKMTKGLFGSYRSKAKTQISPQDLDFIEQNLNKEQEERYGYDVGSLLLAERSLAIGS
jgi:hypothetical protein